MDVTHRRFSRLRNLPPRLITAAIRRMWALLGRIMRSHEMWSLIDAAGIVIFVGPNGSGKSLAAVASTLSVLDGESWECGEVNHRHHEPYRLHQADCADGCTLRVKDQSTWCDAGLELFFAGFSGHRLVYSTVTLLDDNGDDHPRFVPLTDYRQLLRIEHADVLFDEVAGVSDASDSGSMPVQVTQWLHTLRKADVRLRVTTPAYARCSKPIRQVAQVVVDARSFAPELASSGRRWRPRQAMIYRAFDAFAFADYTPSTKERLPSLARAAFWRPGSRAETSYDTLGQVLALGHVTEAGMCAVCGGTRRRPACACTADVDELPADRLEVTENVTPAGGRTRKALPIVGAPETPALPSGLRSLPPQELRGRA